MPSASIQRRASRPISLTTPTPSSIGFAATCRWIASASLPSTCPSAHADSTISSTTRRAWMGSKRCTEPIVPKEQPGGPSTPRRRRLRGLSPLDVALEHPGNDDQQQDERDADDDLQPAHVLGQLVRRAEGVSESDDDRDLDHGDSAVDSHELPRRQLRRPDGQIDGAAQSDEESPQQDGAELVPL